MSFEGKCEILHDLYMERGGDEEYSEFISTNDIGIPLAYMVVMGAAVPTEAGILDVEYTYMNFCELLGIDSYGDYDSLDAMIDLSENGEPSA